MITSFKKTEPGTDGGISLKGSAAAVAGALFIAGSLYLVSSGVNELFAITIAVSGLAGCIVDSYLGAIYQSGTGSEKENNEEVTDDYLNSIINWVATGSAALIAIIITQLITYEMV